MSLLAAIVYIATSLSITGTWQVPNGDTQVSFWEKGAKVKIIVKVDADRRKPLIVPFAGKIVRREGKVLVSATSKPLDIDDGCHVRMLLVFHGTRTSPDLFQVRAHMVSFVSCGKGKDMMFVDDLSGTWKFLSGPKHKKKLRSKGKKINI
jgi:hypothetical protein